MGGILLVRNLRLGYLKSRTIGEAFIEIKTLPLGSDASAYVNNYTSIYKLRITSNIQSIHAALKQLNPLLGFPIGYAYSYPLRDPDLSKRVEGRVIQWKIKDLAQAIEASNRLDAIGVDFIVSKANITIGTHLNIFLSVLLKSDDPAYWERENKRKYEMFMKNRKIREVKKKIDRMV